MRGKQSGKHVTMWKLRITPAGAGKTEVDGRSGAGKADHPRRCGENHQVCRTGSIQPGSPPQVRGKPKRLMVDSFGDRITPAGAGKTPICKWIRRWQEDHPRRCGENILVFPEIERTRGSPPQVRGKPAKICPTEIAPRITPAGAGKTAFPLQFQRKF